MHKITFEMQSIDNGHQVGPFYAVNPLLTELHGLLGKVTQACADASDIWSSLIPALQILAMERMCFIPY